MLVDSYLFYAPAPILVYIGTKRVPPRPGEAISRAMIARFGSINMVIQMGDAAFTGLNDGRHPTTVSGNTIRGSSAGGPAVGLVGSAPARID